MPSTPSLLCPAPPARAAAHANEHIKRAASATTAKELASAIRTAQNAQVVDRRVHAALAEAGLSACPTCSGPILDPADCDYAAKMELLDALPGGCVRRCECGHVHLDRATDGDGRCTKRARPL